MKRLTTGFTGLAVFIMLSFSALAQKGFIKAGDNAFKNREYFNAIEIYKKAVAGNLPKGEKARVLFQIGECNRIIGDVKQAEKYYSQALKANYDDPVVLLYLGDAQKQMGNMDEAIASYTEYQSKVPSDPRGANGIMSCKVAGRLKDSATRWVVTNMGQLNTKFLDFSLTFSDRRLDEFVFTSTRQGVAGDKVDPGVGQNYSDLYITKLDKNGKFSAPVPLPAPINSDGNEGAATFDKAFKTMYFTRCNVIKNKGEHCHIYTADRRGNAWTDPVMLDFQADTATYVHPSISGDGQTLFYSSNLPGGYGGMDLWLSHYDKKTRKFGAPINLGPGVNTAGAEVFPFIHPDGSLYFSSNGWPGMGGLDIFRATAAGTDKWANPVNMGQGINSEADDFGIIFEGTKQKGYLSSNRAGGKGLDDIYSFIMPPLIFALKGVVTDTDTHKGIPGATVRMVGSDGSDVSMKTDATGGYIFGLNGNARYVNINTSYIISASATDLKYLASKVKENETTVGKNESETFIHNFTLQKPPLVIRLPEVVFPLDEATLLPESKDSLADLITLLKNNPTLAIELDAHTDQQGTPGHNLPLSQARAQACVDYLISQGIDSARLTPKGWGQTKLLKTDADIKAAHTKREKDSLYHMNRRVAFQILNWSYVPKGHVMTRADSLIMKQGQKTIVNGQEIIDTNNISAPMSIEEQQSLIPPTKGDKTPAKPGNGNTPNNNNNGIKPKQDN